MKRFDNAVSILDLVFASKAARFGVPSGCGKRAVFFVIAGQYGPRWIVPACSHLGWFVLAQWRPYSLVSKCKWKGLLLAYAGGMLGKVPGIKIVSVEARNTLTVRGTGPSFTPVVYVGTPGPQQKAVVTLVSPQSGEPRAILKVAMREGGQESLMREAITLQKLSGTDVPGVPAFLALEDSGKRTWQTVIGGRLTSRKLTRAHIDWLLKLPVSESSTTLNEQQALLRHDFERDLSLFGDHRRAINEAIAKIQGGRIPLVLVHGDFAPWNLKLQADGKIAAIDWEEADWSGLPLWDLCHFFFIQAHLFEGRNPVRMLNDSPWVQLYLLKMEIDKKNLAALVLLYILFTVFKVKASCSGAYRGFLLSQIPSVVVV